MTTETQTKGSQLMLFFGSLFLLIGLYGGLRIVHVQVRKVPYPSSGVFPQNLLFTQNTTSYGRESDCDQYPQVYYDYGTDGKQKPRPATEEEIGVQQQLLVRCINGFNEDRAKQAQRDRNEAAFLIFVGAGLLIARKIIK